MPGDVVTAFQRALSDRDLDAARALLRDDLRFTGPFEAFESADDYLEAVRRLSKVVESIDVKHMSKSGDQVVLLYDMVTTTPAGTQLICEWYGIANGSIAWIRAIFDTAPFAFLRDAK